MLPMATIPFDVRRAGDFVNTGTGMGMGFLILVLGLAGLTGGLAACSIFGAPNRR